MICLGNSRKENVLYKLFNHCLTLLYTQNSYNDINMTSRCPYYKHFTSLLTVERYLVTDIKVFISPGDFAFSTFNCTMYLFLQKVWSSYNKISIHVGRHVIIQETKYFVYSVKAVEMYNGLDVNFMSYSIAVDITIRVSNAWLIGISEE